MMKKSQITIEYLIFAAVMVLIMLFVIGRSNSPVQTGAKKFLDDLGNQTAALIGEKVNVAYCKIFGIKVSCALKSKQKRCYTIDDQEVPCN